MTTTTTGLVKTQSRAELNKLPPEEWRARCLALSPPLRYAVARVIWWEFFGARTVADRWPHLDDLIEHTVEVPDEVLAAGLVCVGWSGHSAAYRAGSPAYSRNPAGSPRHRKNEVRKFLTHRASKYKPTAKCFD
jgi:hypothetical protein